MQPSAGAWEHEWGLAQLSILRALDSIEDNNLSVPDTPTPIIICQVPVDENPRDMCRQVRDANKQSKRTSPSGPRQPAHYDA